MTEKYEFGDVHEIKLQAVDNVWAFTYEEDGIHNYDGFSDPFEALSAAVAHLSTMAHLKEQAAMCEAQP